MSLSIVLSCVIGAAVVLIAWIVVHCFFLKAETTQWKKRREEKRIKDLMIHLDGMDVEDLNIQCSPLGGFNLSYLNGLARGINKSARTLERVPSEEKCNILELENDEDEKDLHEESSAMCVQWQVISISVPAMTSNLLMQLIYFINAICAGKLIDPEAKLAAVGIGTCLIEFVCLWPIVGLNGAMETLVSQAFGANELKLCGKYLNRACVINTTVFAPLAVTLILFTKPILKTLGQEESVIEHARKFILFNLFSVYLLGMYDMVKRYLNCHKQTWIPMIAQVIATTLHIVWCYLFVLRLEWDLLGLGLASTMTCFVLLTTTLLYLDCVPEIRNALSWPDATIWIKWLEYFGLGIPAALIVLAFISSRILLLFLSGVLGVLEQDNMMIIWQIWSVVVMMSLGLQEAAAVLVGNEIGDNNAPKAYQAAKVVLLLGLGMVLVVAGLVYLHREKLVHLFGIDNATMALETIPLLCLQNVLESVSGTFMGCVRGLGIQSKVVLYQTLCYYLVAIPAASYLAFAEDAGIFGLMVGSVLGELALVLVLAFKLVFENWQDAADTAYIRIMDGIEKDAV